ncbi:Battenin [Meloidogyne graminicola]|uniref:Battenin n=1 Tax=Meloidogyne graminicola TaxID=189291 RepID=A0A8S9ZH99_9BILA|nr:Battenin [Meloidogyne graminicola]
MVVVKRNNNVRDLIAFWIFGLSNNFAYVIMLSAADDIIRSQSSHSVEDMNNNSTIDSKQCIEDLGKPRCEKYMSTGAILLADILPALIIKYTLPFFMNRIPFGFRHLLVCLLQAFSYLFVAFSPNIYVSLFGVVLAAMGSGLGEICYLALSSHYAKSTIAAWSSGTGGAGIAGALAYAILTEPKFFDLTPRIALIVMLIVPTIFVITYWLILTPVSTVHKMNLFKISSWVVPVHKSNEFENINFNKKVDNKDKININYEIAYTQNFSLGEKLRIIFPLLRYMIPLSFVYFAEYLINSGLHQLIHFNCSHGFSLSLESQFRWYMALYQSGVFFSRTSIAFIKLPIFVLYLLPFLQCLNLAIFLIQSINQFIPYIGIIFILTFIEGIFGGASYANTFDRIHKETSFQTREFSLSIASSGDSIGISLAGFASIIVHNYICQLYPRLY